jgi:branched-chain amino acid transport system ATP-binding protein
MNILETKNLSKHFGGVAAVDRFSISVEKGKITSIVGPNGSGKTTLVNVLCGFFPMTGGAIIIDGAELKRINAPEVASYGITRTFQEVRLWNQLPVLDNILVAFTERTFLGALFEKYSAYHLKRAEELLRKMNLWEKRHELAGNLSYGQRKLLEVARALAMDAEIYLFDEPFAGLFPEMAKIVVAALKELRAEGKTSVLIEHNMDLVRELSDHTIVMDGGELLAEGRPAEVLKERKVIEAYLGE